jgi:uncharacterized protein (DUF4213/DUF364 family)
MKSTLKKPASSEQPIISKFLLYDELIDGIPSDLPVKKVVTGIHWTAVHSEGVGLAMSPPEGERSLKFSGTIAGKTVREIASLSKSWHPLEAALGVAALNSWYNAPSVIEKSWGPINKKISSTSVFSEVGSFIKGKKVTVIGHFPDLDQLREVCQLSILERKPLPGDFPDPACEYILPYQDFVFMTGVTLINKTLPRLLELSRNASITLVGPSVPLTPLFKKYHVSLLAGTVVTDPKMVMTHIAEGGDRSIFRFGASTLRLKCSSNKKKGGILL